MRKFTLNQQVVINHNGYLAYPEGTTATVVCFGAKVNNQYTYHIRFNNGSVLTRILENEIKGQYEL